MPEPSALPVARHPDPTFPRARLFEGLFAPTLTPYHSDGRVNVALVPVLGQRLLDDGVAGVFVLGTMGEGILLPVEDRRELTEAWVAFAGPKGSRALKVIAHVGAENGRTARELAAHAEGVGVDAVACMAPCVYKARAIADLVGYLASVAAACPKTPFLYYHCTYLTGPTFRCVDILRALDLAIPNMKGCKMTDKDIGDLALCLQYFPDMDIFPAYDNQFLLCATLGPSAFIMAGFNVLAPLYLKCWRSLKQGDLPTARTAMARLLDFWERLDAHHAGGYGKLCHCLKILVGLKCGADLGPPCPPIPLLTEEETRGSLATLHDWGWTDWAIAPSD